MREMRKKIMPVLDIRLGEYGFKRKKTYDVFIKEINDNLLYTIGFGVSHGSVGVFYLNPNVAVLYKDENDIEMMLRGIKSDIPDYVGGRIGLPLGYLMPEKTYIEWRFSRNEDVTGEANKMADAIIKYGFPFLEELSNRDNVIYGLEIGKYSDLDGTMLPVFHYLNGNIKRALECIDENIKKFSKPNLEKYEIERLKRLAGDNGEFHVINNNGIKYYLEFVDNFKKMVEAHKDDNVKRERY